MIIDVETQRLTTQAIEMLDRVTESIVILIDGGVDDLIERRATAAPADQPGTLARLAPV